MKKVEPNYFVLLVAVVLLGLSGMCCEPNKSLAADQIITSVYLYSGGKLIKSWHDVGKVDFNPYGGEAYFTQNGMWQEVQGTVVVERVRKGIGARKERKLE